MGDTNTYKNIFMFWGGMVVETKKTSQTVAAQGIHFYDLYDLNGSRNVLFMNKM